jgi:hypothetical protein
MIVGMHLSGFLSILARRLYVAAAEEFVRAIDLAGV